MHFKNKPSRKNRMNISITLHYYCSNNTILCFSIYLKNWRDAFKSSFQSIWVIANIFSIVLYFSMVKHASQHNQCTLKELPVGMRLKWHHTDVDVTSCSIYISMMSLRPPVHSGLIPWVEHAVPWIILIFSVHSKCFSRINSHFITFQHRKAKFITVK